jgi:hypothetical protein
VSFAVRGGRLLRDGRPFTVLGVNYHPSRAGCRIWADWDPAAIREDFAAIASSGLNAVRLFLFWRDFQPRADEVDETAIERLREVVTLAAEHGLACLLSLFTIWMNGQRLDPAWRRGRSLWRNPAMMEIEERYARRVARALGDLDNVLGIDLGDEIAHVDPAESASLTPDEVRAWYQRTADVVREEASHLLVTQANDPPGVLGSSPFGPDTGAALDLACVHGFPLWAPGSIESTLSYKGTALVPFLTRYAAAFGVPLVDELGCYGVDEATATAYLGATAASALANGAAGVVVWCWRDIASVEEPYRERPGEREVGLVRLDGSGKPRLEEYRRVVRAAGELASLEREPARVAIYLPERLREGGHTYLDTGSGVGGVATFFAYLLLKRAHLEADLVTGGLERYALVVCPSVRHLTLPDVDRLESYVSGGGAVYLSLADHLHGFPGADLAGVERVDFSLVADGLASFTWDGEEWPVDWEAAGARPFTVRAAGAEVLASFAGGGPAVTSHRHGRGRFVLCAAPLEGQLDRPGRLEALPWERLYLRIADLAGVTPAVDCADPAVEVVLGRRDGVPRAVVVNHGPGPVRAGLRWRGSDGPVSVGVSLAAKGWAIVGPGDPEVRA